MSEPHCINLDEWFGRDYCISFRTSYDPRNIPREELDPWYMVILGRHGIIYPAGGTTLAVIIDERPKLAARLRRLPWCVALQGGDEESIFLFDVGHFAEVAAIVLPRRRRVSRAERLRLAAFRTLHGFGLHQSGDVSGAPTHPN
jgi:hypothetical protein